MPERIRAGIVGASPQSWAAAAHLPALAHLDELVPAWSTATAAAWCTACSPPKPPSAAPASTSGHPAPGGRSCTSTTWPRSTWPSPPGTVWHGASQTIRLDVIATALGGGTAISWPASAASAELGLLADLFTRDQDVSSAKTRAVLDWTPVHTSIVEYLAT
jgi:hypothetical protein